MTQVNSSQGNPKTNKGKLFWAVAAFLGVGALLFFIGVRIFQNETSAVEFGEAPSDFTLTTFSGDIINTADLRGKVTLINFWASWCNTCDEEAVMLENAWQQYKFDNPDEVVFLGIAYMDTKAASLDFLSTYGVTYVNGPDLRGAISNIYRVSSVPETFILDQDGTLRYVKFGPFSSLREITEAVDSVLVREQD